MAVPSFPAVHVTGPVHHFVRTRASFPSIYYLGTCEVTPQMRVRRYVSPVHNDLAGDILPLQRTYGGDAATVGVLLTYWSKFAAALPATPTTAATALQYRTPGEVNVAQETRWARGSLINGQWTFELWQVFDNFFNPAVAAQFPGLEIGRYWPQALSLDDDLPESGTRAQKKEYVFDMTPFFIPQASQNGINAPPSGTLNERGWFLTSTDPAFFPADVSVPQ